MDLHTALGGVRGTDRRDERAQAGAQDGKRRGAQAHART
jgi:hypothetical protein